MTRIQTPISLNWLIKRRAKIDGERKRAIDEHRLLIERASSTRDSLRHAEKQLAMRKSELQELLAHYECALQSLDNVLQLHEVQIDTTLIKSVKQHTSPAALGHGDMGRLIFKHLRENPGAACSTSEIAKYVWENKKSNRVVNFNEFRFRLRKRLAVLAWEGRIVNVNSNRGVEGLWMLSLDTQHEVQQALHLQISQAPDLSN